MDAVKEASDDVVAKISDLLPFVAGPDDVTVSGVDCEQSALDIEDLYDTVCAKLRAHLFEKVKKLLRSLVAKESSTDNCEMDINALNQSDEITPFGKYDTPVDETDNYIVYLFGIENGKLYAEGRPVNDGGKTTFSEYDFSNDELREIATLLQGVKQGLDDGNYSVDKGGVVSMIENA